MHEYLWDINIAIFHEESLGNDEKENCKDGPVVLLVKPAGKGNLEFKLPFLVNFIHFYFFSF